MTGALCNPTPDLPRYRIERLEGPARRVIDRATNAAVASFHAGHPDPEGAAEEAAAYLNRYHSEIEETRR